MYKIHKRSRKYLFVMQQTLLRLLTFNNMKHMTFKSFSLLVIMEISFYIKDCVKKIHIRKDYVVQGCC